MKNIIITNVVSSDRNIYLTVNDGALVSVNFSHGIDYIDFDFMRQDDPELTRFVINSLQEHDGTWSAEYFFPSPYWDEQVNLIDMCIWQYLNLKERKATISNQIADLREELNQVIEKLTRLTNNG
jgi:hypothetical protein